MFVCDDCSAAVTAAQTASSISLDGVRPVIAAAAATRTCHTEEAVYVATAGRSASTIWLDDADADRRESTRRMAKTLPRLALVADSARDVSSCRNKSNNVLFEPKNSLSATRLLTVVRFLREPNDRYTSAE